MSGGIYFRLSVGRAGTSAANARYIIRLSATGSDARAIHLHNYPAFVAQARGFAEMRERVVEYNRQREQDELRRPRRGGSGEVRTHYRCRMSFEGKVDTEKALALAAEYLEKSFPNARAVACVHQDTAHTHVHINLEARQVNSYKIDINPSTYRRWDT